jgi:hypothetical protein
MLGPEPTDSKTAPANKMLGNMIVKRMIGLSASLQALQNDEHVTPADTINVRA